MWRTFEIKAFAEENSREPNPLFLLEMNPYNDVIIGMLADHIFAKDRAIDKLAVMVKALNDELKRIQSDLEPEVKPEAKPNAKPKYKVKSVIRWEPQADWYSPEYKTRNRAVGLVLKDGFFEFARFMHGTKTTRTYYASVEEWMASLPETNDYTFDR
jgi:hypothetical protein